jgi:hypothetical protein
MRSDDRLKLFRDERKFPDLAVVDSLVYFRCKTDQALDVVFFARSIR